MLLRFGARLTPAQVAMNRRPTPSATATATAAHTRPPRGCGAAAPAERTRLAAAANRVPRDPSLRSAASAVVRGATVRRVACLLLPPQRRQQSCSVSCSGGSSRARASPPWLGYHRGSAFARCTVSAVRAARSALRVLTFPAGKSIDEYALSAPASDEMCGAAP